MLAVIETDSRIFIVMLNVIMGSVVMLTVMVPVSLLCYAFFVTKIEEQINLLYFVT
jgi:hypothetical protein